MSEVSFTQPRRGFVQASPAQPIHAPTRYVVNEPKATLISGYTTSPLSGIRAAFSDGIFLRLSPIERWKYLARYDKSEFVLSLAALGGGLYMLIAAADHIVPHLLSWSASAQTPGGFSTSRDSFDWYVGGLMGVALLSSLGMTMFAQMQSKVTFGKDTTRMILGFVVGFLTGGNKPR